MLCCGVAPKGFGGHGAEVVINQDDSRKIDGERPEGVRIDLLKSTKSRVLPPRDGIAVTAGGLLEPPVESGQKLEPIKGTSGVEPKRNTGFERAAPEAIMAWASVPRAVSVKPSGLEIAHPSPNSSTDQPAGGSRRIRYRSTNT